MIKETYDIGGMHCAACSSAVERVTRKLPGVTESAVNLPMNRLTITYDETQCSPEDIIAKVERAGFTASPHAERQKSESTDNDDRKALLTERNSLIVSVIAAGLLLFVSMGHMLCPSMPFPDIISPVTHPTNYALLELLLAVPVLVLCRRFFSSGFRSLLHGNPNMDTLVALSSSASLIFSIVMTFMIPDHPEKVHELYYESSAVVLALVSVGKYLEARSKKKTKEAITRLRELAPGNVVLVDENGQWDVPAEMIKPGDVVLVKPGARVPLDGVVTRGSGTVDESMLTGESMPVEKTVGSEVTGGSISLDGALYVEVTRTGDDTTLSGIIRFVEEAQGGKAPISRTADRVAGVFVPVVMGIATVAAAVWLLTGASLSFALRIFTTVLVIACPCAMGLATPTAIIVGTGLGASKGILVRSGEALENSSGITTVIFDKTGTITEGRPAVTDILSGDERRMMSAAASLEALSDHPLSRAICAKAAEMEVAGKGEISDFESIPGRGLSGVLDGAVILAGNTAFMQEKGVDVGEYADRATALENDGRTVVYVAEGGTLLGAAAIADTIKPDAAAAVKRLHGMGVKTVLLTGDNRAAAEYIGRAAGITDVVSGVLPTEKAEIVKKYQRSGEKVMMVGDGINDAPALAQADTGCAVGAGSDIAIDSADIVLMNDRTEDVCRAMRLGRLTIRNIRQNLFWAFCYNALCIPVAAGALYPSLGLLLSPMIGGAAMSLSSLFVVTNALRLRGKKL